MFWFWSSPFIIFIARTKASRVIIPSNIADHSKSGIPFISFYVNTIKSMQQIWQFIVHYLIVFCRHIRIIAMNTMTITLMLLLLLPLLLVSTSVHTSTPYIDQKRVFKDMLRPNNPGKMMMDIMMLFEMMMMMIMIWQWWLCVLHDYHCVTYWERMWCVSVVLSSFILDTQWAHAYSTKNYIE